ncbi:multiple epidermal growth factor-like domains protein 10 [Gigantopelta aegis]|uniref:multiple epidermal growth factor-like domains protein 10 n=1 Tax=Gigantopelta aegis TaxID=1735272 RepID=UPI001B88AFD2|nr:multiple epidermal growth factor-like domains protein 10 [Gigantopelta aegis]
MKGDCETGKYGLDCSYTCQCDGAYCRDDTDTYRRNGVYIYSSTEANQTNTGHRCGSTTKNSPGITTVTCGSTARYITLYREIPNGESTMDFCEVEVYICYPGTFGDDCSQFCHCLNGPCKYSTGECTGGCKPNWSGTKCTVCDFSHYGDLCSKNCSSRHCHGISTCNANGECSYGCDLGWRGTDCMEKCPFGRYGKYCAKYCTERNCLDSSRSCDRMTGECAGGCNRGYRSVDCSKSCSDGTYGYNCSASCVDRHCSGNLTNQECDRFFGTCTQGCLSGWDLPDCAVRCHDGTYGPGCKFNCRESHCKGVSTSCDPENGMCLNGCQPGWKNPRCSVACDTGTYGPDCRLSCSQRYCQDESASCDHVTGSCGGPCKGDWKERDCTVKADTSNAYTDNRNFVVIAVSVVAGVLFVLLVIVTSLSIWKIKGNRAKWDSYQQEMTKTNTNPPRQPTDPSAVEYEIVDRQDGGHNSPRGSSSQQVSTSRSANYGNSPTSRGVGYVNADQTNEYEKLDLPNP